MGPRARSATAVCLAAAGLWLGGVDATASATPADSGNTAGDERPEGRPHVNPPPSAAATPGRRDAVKKWRRSQRAAHQRDRGPADPCCDDGGEDCGPGWPWPGDPEPPGIPAPEPPQAHGGVSDRPVKAPRPGLSGGTGVGAPETRPPADLPFDPGVLDVVPGAGLPATGAGAPISVPVLPVPAPAMATGPAAAGPRPPAAPSPAAPARPASESPPVRQTQPVENILAGQPPVPTRLGYGEPLRTAGTSQLAALALPGVVGILILTAAGGVVGYRQAKAGQTVRARGTARFMN